MKLGKNAVMLLLCSNVATVLFIIISKTKGFPNFSRKFLKKSIFLAKKSYGDRLTMYLHETSSLCG